MEKNPLYSANLIQIWLRRILKRLQFWMGSQWTTTISIRGFWNIISQQFSWRLDTDYIIFLFVFFLYIEMLIFIQSPILYASELYFLLIVSYFYDWTKYALLLYTFSLIIVLYKWDKLNNLIMYLVYTSLNRLPIRSQQSRLSILMDFFSLESSQLVVTGVPSRLCMNFGEISIRIRLKFGHYVKWPTFPRKWPLGP